MTRITTTIKRKWLAAIVAGTKKFEYREVKPYWILKLLQSGGTTIPCPFELRLINGMSKKAPEVTVLIDNIDIGPQEPFKGYFEGDVFRLRIKKILSVKNWKP